MLKAMENTRIQELAATVRYSLSQIEELKTIANLTYSEIEKIVRIAHEAKHEDLQPIIDLVRRGVNIS